MAKRMYVGTNTHSGGDAPARENGIFWFQFDEMTGKLVREGAVPSENASYLTLSEDNRHLYAVNELVCYQNPKGGGVSAFAVEPNSGQLTFLNQQPSDGEDPCFVSLDKTGKWALVSNYSGGSVVVYPIAEDGRLGAKSDFIQHQGHGPNAKRQEKAHAHSIQMDPMNRIALAADLGLDQVKLYGLDLSQGKLAPHTPAYLQVHPGAGPRHLNFHPNGRWLYVVNELDSTLCVFDYQAENGSANLLQTVSMLPEGYSGEKWAADVHVHPNGRFVVASNRGNDSLAVFKIDPKDGKVTLAGNVGSGGRLPRNFAIDPSGKWLIAANQKGNNLVVFAFDPESGAVKPTGETVELMAPMCIKFVR